MATLAAISDNVRRRLGLGLGSHTITVSDYSNIAADSTITVHGITLTMKAAATTEVADFIAQTSNNATAQNIDDLIGNIFDGTTGVSVSVSGAVVTVTGAKSVTSSDSTRLTVSSSTYQDEPPYTSDIDQWILDGQNHFVDVFSNRVLMSGFPGLGEKFSLTGDGTATEINLPSDFVRESVVTAQIGSDAALYRLILVTLEELFLIRNGRHSTMKVNAADKAEKYYAIADDQMYFSAAPVSGAEKVLIYGIKEPQTAKASECDLPDHLEPLLEDYVVIRAYEQMQRYDMARALWEHFMANVDRINNNYGV